MLRIVAVFTITLSAWVLFSAKGRDKIHFHEVASSRGVVARLSCGDPARRWIPEANGTGAAWLDYDNDGWMDLLIVNGANMEVLRKIVAGQTPPARPGGVYLYHNLGNGRFEDVTAKAGLSNPYWGTGVNAADYNNDGYTDILITTIGVDLLYSTSDPRREGDSNGRGAVGGLSPGSDDEWSDRAW